MKTGDMYTDQKGYLRYCDSHYPVHRRAMEKKLGRRLKRGEIVHHENGNKQDNSPDNLKLITPQEHFKIHVLPVLDERRDAHIKETLVPQVEARVAKAVVGGVALLGLVMLLLGLVTGASLKMWYFGLVFVIAAGAAYLVVRGKNRN